MRSTSRDNDTICAPATAPGVGAIAVIRVSGPAAVAVVRRLAAFLPADPESHRVYYGILKSPGSGEALDEVLIAYFRPGRSFTGEATCEISCHGGEAVVDEIMTELISAGARPAERGEFTYRAYIHGRVDLVQAESVLGLIESRSPRASRLAMRQLRGELSDRLSAVREDLTWVLAQLEANIDYAGEDIVIATAPALTARLERAAQVVETLRRGYRRGRALRDGFQVALVGAPNVGKSSLLNALCGEERAIVTPVAGTTRDFVEGTLSVAGVRVRLIDTAGLRATDDPVESIGVARTLARLPEVDLILLVVDAGQPGLPDLPVNLPTEAWLVVNKSDLGAASVAVDHAAERFDVSAMTGAGLDALRSRLRAVVGGAVGEDSVLISNARQFRGLSVIADSLAAAMPLVARDDSPDLIALELQSGLRAVYDILGETYDDQVVDLVFAEFCLGK